MNEYSKITIAEMLNTEKECSCGHKHKTDIKYVEVGAGKLDELVPIINKLHFKKAFIVADINTDFVLGVKVKQILTEQSIAFKYITLPSVDVVPDEHTLGHIMMEYNKDCDFIIGIGTGTINDLCKFASFMMCIPYMIVATAPSMDGFASVGSALITNNLKTTYNTHVPIAIVADTDYLVDAPMEMITAGFSDILGKYTCLCDWKLSNIINDEYYCDYIHSIMKGVVAKTVSCIDGILDRDQKSIQTVTEALIISGIAMSYVGNSRPASGSEHHISHYWEMMFLLAEKKPVLHGTKVGIGTITSLLIYEYILTHEINFELAEQIAKDYDFTKWENKIKTVFQDASDGVIKLEKLTGKNETEAVLDRLAIIKSKWKDIIDLISTSLPSSKEIENMITQMQSYTNPFEIGVTKDEVIYGIKYAKEVRDRYTVLQFIWDLGIADEVSEYIAERFEKQYKE